MEEGADDEGPLPDFVHHPVADAAEGADIGRGQGGQEAVQLVLGYRVEVGERIVTSMFRLADIVLNKKNRRNRGDQREAESYGRPGDLRGGPYTGGRP